MNLKELKALRYYLAFVFLVVSFYVYSGVVGWKWIGATSTETNTTENQGGSRYRYFHK